MHLDPNPGGILEPVHIIGREGEIARYWKILRRQSLILGGERRIGKTHIVRKMHAYCEEGFVTFYQQLEKVHSILELIRAVYGALDVRLSPAKKIKQQAVSAWMTLVPQRVGALELPQARSNWKQLLTTAIKDMLDLAEPGQRIVLIWDELPLMLYNLRKREGGDVAIQLLDLLRALRQEHGTRLRFLFTGSIGLHLVLRSLRGDGNANAPTNDMYAETVPPMADDEVRELTRLLLGSLDLPPPALAAATERILAEVGGFPHWIHHVSDQLVVRGSAGPEDVADVIEELVMADHDPVEFGYYLTRIATYYTVEEARIACALLDALCVHETPLPLENLTNLVRHAFDVSDLSVRDVCRLLRQDHYLTLGQTHGYSTYDFRWSLLKRWWRRNRA